MKSWSCIGLFLAGFALLAGCGSDAPTDTSDEVKVHVPGGGGAGSGTGASGSQPAPGTGQAGVNAPEELGVWRGHWNGKQLTFTPIDAKAAASGIRPQGFVQLNDAQFGIDTTNAMVINAGCTANNDPANNYFGVDGSDRPFGAGTCTNQHLCADVTVTNNGTRAVDSLYVEVTSITSGFHGDGSSLATVPTGYPVSNTLGLWRYGTLNGGGSGGKSVVWNFFLPSCEDFTFIARVMGTVRRTSYVASADFLTTGEFIDACTDLTHTTVLAGAASGTSTGLIPLPFPFTLYDFTFDSSVSGTAFRINSSGALGFTSVTNATGANTSLPTGSFTRVLLPFWDNLQTPNGVCYGSTGTTPNRKFVVTWKNATFADAPAGTVTFSAVLDETTDNVTFQYRDCSDTNSRNNGDSATVGVQGAAGTATTHSFNTEFLPIFCPDGYKVTLSAQPPGNGL